MQHQPFKAFAPNQRENLLCKITQEARVLEQLPHFLLTWIWWWDTTEKTHILGQLFVILLDSLSSFCNYATENIFEEDY